MSITKQASKTELFLAIERGDTEQVMQIINKFPDLINVRASNNWTQLMFATRYNYFEIVKFLVESGANLEQKNPLFAAQYNNFCNH